MAFYQYSWQYCPYTERSIEAYITFYQGGTIDHVTHVLLLVAQSSEESEYNAACTSVMALEIFMMLIHELLNKDPDIVPEEAPIIIFDSKSAAFMDNNSKIPSTQGTFLEY